jgi:UDP-N-acetylmuramate--alanine ligase
VDWLKIKKVYMIGVKGVGMTMLAQYLTAQGIAVAGSDVADVFMTDEVLAKAGIKIKLGFKADNLPADADLIIYSTAYNKDNPEVAAAFASKTKTVIYAEALADVFNQNFGIAVAGSHGKTTVSAWLGFVLHQAGLKPSALVGAYVPQFGGAALIGKSNLLVAEADEYQNKLALLKPKMALLNNIDYDHPDFYPDRAAYEQAFADFVHKLSAKDVLVANFDETAVKRLSAQTKAKVISYALACEADFRAREITYHNGRQYFKVTMSEDNLGDFSIGLAGRHNVANALAVIAAATELGADLHLIRGAVADFSGASRRLEKLGEFNGALIYDDYAHHPTEIKATIAAVRQLYPDRKLTVVFHPHTFSRTKALFNDFVSSFADVDELIVLDIYGSVRETQGGVSAEELVEKMRLLYEGKEIIYLPTLTAAADYLRHNAQADEVVVLMGAGDVFRIADDLLKKGKN